MASKSRSGMTDYVANKNVRQDGLDIRTDRQGYDDLKVSTVQPAGRSPTKRTSNGKLKSQGRVELGRSSDQKRYDDTDASLADITSNSASAGKVSSSERQKISLNDNNVEVLIHDNGGERLGSDVFEGDAEPEKRETPIKTDTARHVGLTNAHTQVEIDKRPSVDNLRRLSGDSYPETTSGQPSIADADASRDVRMEPQPFSATLPERGDGFRYTYSKLPSHKSVSAVQHNASTPANNSDGISGFQYHDPRVRNVQIPHARQPDVTQPSTRSHIQNAQQLPYLQAKRTLSPRGREDGHAAATNVKHHHPQFHQAHPPHESEYFQQVQPLPRSNNSTKVSDPALEPDHRNRKREENWPAIEQSSQHLPDHELDYERTALLSMEYAALRAQSFDKDPRPPGNRRLPSFPAGNSLQDNLDYVAKLDPQVKAEFFTELSIDEWESAGEWFLDRFRDVSRRMIKARCEKRAIAQDLENEIEERHKAVKKKREETDVALTQMRKSGTDLLQGTPTKSNMGKNLKS